MAYGVTTTGFAVKPLDVLKSELEALVRGTFGAATKVNPSSKWGQFIGILADRESDLWDLAQAVYSARDPEQATGAALEAICAITGIRRLPARRSALSGVTLTGSPGTVVPAGKIASVVGTGAQFRLVADATIGGGGTGTGSFESVNTGAIEAPAGTLTKIETPVAGWTSVSNPTDALPGAAAETDPALRRRRINTLALAGSAATDAIYSEIRHLPSVTSCTVFFNDDDVTNADGMPPHSIEVVVSGGTDAEIGAAIWNSKAAGIRTVGTVAVTVKDAADRDQVVRFSRPDVLNVYAAITIEVDPDRFPGDGADLLVSAITEWGADHLAGGVTLYPRALMPPIFSIAGVLNVPTVALGLAPGPTTETPIAVTGRQVALLDSSRITINVV